MLAAWRQMAGVAQRDRAACDASGGHPGCCGNRRYRRLGRNPDGGAIIPHRGEPGRHARRRRDRAQHQGVRTRLERGFDRAKYGGGGNASVWSCCASSSPLRPSLPRSSTRPMPKPRSCRDTCRQGLAPSGCSSTCCMRATNATSIRFSQPWSNCGQVGW
jgi:hypothetical protein